MENRFADVILPLPLDGCFTYRVPPELAPQPVTGSIVTVPFGARRTYKALVLNIHTNEPQGDYAIKDIIAIDSPSPAVLPEQIKFWQWMAGYYMCSVGDVLKAAMPSADGYKPKTEQRLTLAEQYRDDSSLKKLMQSFGRATKQRDAMLTFIKMAGAEYEPVPRQQLLEQDGISATAVSSLTDKGILTQQTAEVTRLDTTSQPTGRPEPLTPAQQQALDSIKRSFREKNVCLLYGVTSSGKTEVYIHLMEETIRQGRQVLYLLPEIAMTAQIMRRLKRVFGSRIGIYHSKWPDAERVELWQKQLSPDPYPIILGVRSSVFLPFQRLGLVIVDEEHENTYKQQDPAPRYNARNAAIYLASMLGAKTLLGTATPSLESWYNATEGGKYGLVRLTERYSGVQLPDVVAVDIKELKRTKKMLGQFSPELVERMRATLAEQGQVILFQNRRGYAPMMECRDCGWVPKCPHCDVSLTYHKRSGHLVCHYCGFATGVPTTCPNCGSRRIRQLGFGTERIEDEIRRLLPEARVARLDLDTTGSRTNYERILSDFEEQRIDILVGTQIISKGLDFGHVRLVGILNADNMLGYPDFRAYERAFQLMVQVSGRAGRKDKRGLVILQTHDVKNPIIDMVRGNDYEGMATTQLAERRMFRYPPYCRLVYVYLKHRYADRVDQAAAEMAARLRQLLGDRVSEPMQPPVSRVSGLFVRRIILKIENALPFTRVETSLRLIQHSVETDSRFHSISIYFDVDPQ